MRKMPSFSLMDFPSARSAISRFRRRLAAAKIDHRIAQSSNNVPFTGHAAFLEFHLSARVLTVISRVSSIRGVP
jgi:hypothetical protein